MNVSSVYCYGISRNNTHDGGCSAELMATLINNDITVSCLFILMLIIYILLYIYDVPFIQLCVIMTLLFFVILSTIIIFRLMYVICMYALYALLHNTSI